LSCGSNRRMSIRTEKTINADKVGQSGRRQAAER
jgi:hypothetical protein